MSTYEIAPREVQERLERILFRHHKPLLAAEVQIRVIMAHAAVGDDGEPTGPALTAGGYQAAGLARIVNERDRAAGGPDAQIVVDGDRWIEWSEAQRDALLDHESQHFELRTKDGDVVLDSLRRPKLRLRKHDHQFGWFAAVAERHGEASFEVQQAREIFEGAHGQILFPFAADAGHDAEGVVRMAARRGA